jgi:hypothetical protein
MKAARRRIDVNLEELDRVLDGARQAPLSEADHGKLKDALHALAAMLVLPPPRRPIFRNCTASSRAPWATNSRPGGRPARHPRGLVVVGTAPPQPPKNYPPAGTLPDACPKLALFSKKERTAPADSRRPL